MNELPGTGMDFTPHASDYTPFSGISQDAGPTSMLMQLALQALTGNSGYAMMGVNDRNLFDRFEHHRVTTRHMNLVQEMTQMDRKHVEDSVRGVFQLFGASYGDAQREGAQFAAKATDFVVPLLAQMAPMEVDAFFGKRGSAAVFGHFVDSATRRRVDPTTGVFGMTEENSEKLMKQVYGEMFAGDNYLDSPLSAGRAGQLWTQLQAQGVLPGTATMEEIQRQDPARASRMAASAGVDSLSELKNLSPDDRERMLNIPEVNDELVAFDSSRAVSTIRQWGKAVEAMAEIFGDAGRPDAPVPELLNALRVMTAGGTSQLDPNSVTTMVRTMRNLSTNSGMGMEKGSMLIQSAAGQAENLGIESIFAPVAAMEGMATAEAMQATGRLQYQGWGQPDMNTVIQARTAATLSGIASFQTNRTGLALRLNEQLKFDEDTASGQYLQAVRTGQTTFGDDDRSIIMDDDAFSQMIAEDSKGLMTADQVRFKLTQTSANREYIARTPNAIRSTLRAQAEEFGVGQLAGLAEGVAGVNVSDLNATADERFALARVMGQAFGKTTVGDEFEAKFIEDKEARREFQLNTQLEAIEELAASGGPGAEAAEEFLALDRDQQRLKTDLFDDTNSQLTTETGHSLPLMIQTLSPEVNTAAARARSIAWAQGQMQEALAPAGEGSSLRRFMTSLAEPGDKDIKKLAMETFGGVKAEDIVDQLSRKDIDSGYSFQEMLTSSMKDLQDAERDYLAVDDDDYDAKDLAENRLTQQKQQLRDVVRKFASGVDKNFGWDATADPSSINSMMVQANDIFQKIEKGELTDEDLERYKGDAAAMFKAFEEDGLNARRLGPEGLEKIAEVKDLQAEIDSGDLSEREIQTKLEQQRQVLTEVYGKIEQDREDSSAGRLQRIEIGKLMLEDRPLGRASIVLPGDEETP